MRGRLKCRVDFMTPTLTVADLDLEIDLHERRGYRLDMIMPADAPSEALLSKNGELIRLLLDLHRPAESTSAVRSERSDVWVAGRAGMMYRDLIPDRVGGRLIASQIRLARDGQVPDRVHYHKIEFQMIYCLRGRIRVVYEEQGEPFWLEAGDCVVQPPEIRH